MDIFTSKNISPMLIADQKEPFDDDEYIYELKFDGIRTLLYSDGESIEIRNKRNKELHPIIPELRNLCNNINGKVILDGEIIVMKHGKPDFYEVQKRALMTNYSKIELTSNLYPITFIAYDIIYKDGKELIDIPLLERKKILAETVIECNRIAVSKVVENKGVELFDLTKKNGLEGVIAKKKDSKYFYGRRSTDWIKFKNMIDDDYVVLGYIPKQNSMTSLIIGQYTKDMEMIYIGHVTLGVSFNKLMQYNINKIDKPSRNIIPPGNEDAVWLEPKIVVTVEYMFNDNNNLRQPVFRGFRDDKLPTECINY